MNSSIHGQLKHPASCQATWTAANLGRQGWIWEIWSNTLLSEPAVTCCPLRMPRHSYLHKTVWMPHSTVIIDHFLWFGVDGALTMVTVVWRPTHTSSKNISNHVSNSLPRQLSLSRDSIKTVNVTSELGTQRGLLKTKSKVNIWWMAWYINYLYSLSSAHQPYHYLLNVCLVKYHLTLTYYYF